MGITEDKAERGKNDDELPRTIQKYKHWEVKFVKVTKMVGGMVVGR